jgi:hypothetical protein
MAEQQEQVWSKPGNAAARVYVFTEDRPWLNPSMVYSSEAEEVRLPLLHLRTHSTP